MNTNEHNKYVEYALLESLLKKNSRKIEKQLSTILIYDTYNVVILVTTLDVDNVIIKEKFDTWRNITKQGIFNMVNLF